MKLWLDRPDIKESLDDFLHDVANVFQLGTIKKFSRFPFGYQELNIKLETSQGIYAVKTFSREKPLSRVKENIQGYLEFPKLGIPMPKLLVTNNNETILITEGKHQKVYTCVMEYFEGKSFLQLPVTKRDVIQITKCMAYIHQSKLKPAHYYDTLGIVNFEYIYEKQVDTLSAQDNNEIKQTLKEFQRINLTKFHQSVIHGTLERENILKNSQGAYCILDLGCMDYNASIVDIATFLANFTIDMDGEETVEMIKESLTEYQKFHMLTADERLALPILIEAQYAILVMGMTHAMKMEHDDSKQTNRWLEFGKHGLKKFQGIHSLPLQKPMG
ncbi:MAG: phosphotransferase [Patescibacteria group bacterium]